MYEKRRSRRVWFDAKCSLTHNNISYLGRIVNISQNGALISFNEGLVIPLEERCNLSIFIDGLNQPLRMDVEVVHSNFTMIGIKFSAMENSVNEILVQLIERRLTVETQQEYGVKPVRYGEIEG